MASSSTTDSQPKADQSSSEDINPSAQEPPVILQKYSKPVYFDVRQQCINWGRFEDVKKLDEEEQKKAAEMRDAETQEQAGSASGSCSAESRMSSQDAKRMDQPSQDARNMDIPSQDARSMEMPSQDARNMEMPIAPTQHEQQQYYDPQYCFQAVPPPPGLGFDTYYQQQEQMMIPVVQQQQYVPVPQYVMPAPNHMPMYMPAPSTGYYPYSNQVQHYAPPPPQPMYLEHQNQQFQSTPCVAYPSPVLMHSESDGSSNERVLYAASPFDLNTAFMMVERDPEFFEEALRVVKGGAHYSLVLSMSPRVDTAIQTDDPSTARGDGSSVTVQSCKAGEPTNGQIRTTASPDVPPKTVTKNRKSDVKEVAVNVVADKKKKQKEEKTSKFPVVTSANLQKALSTVPSLLVPSTSSCRGKKVPQFAATPSNSVKRDHNQITRKKKSFAEKPVNRPESAAIPPKVAQPEPVHTDNAHEVCEEDQVPMVPSTVEVEVVKQQEPLMGTSEPSSSLPAVAEEPRQVTMTAAPELTNTAKDDTLEVVKANEDPAHPAVVASNADVQKTISKKSIARAIRKKKQEERKSESVQIPVNTDMQPAPQIALPQVPNDNISTEKQSTQTVLSSSKPVNVAEEESAKKHAKKDKKKNAKKPVQKKTAKKENDGSVVSSNGAEARNSKLTTSEPAVTDDAHSVGSDTVEAPIVCTTEVEVAKPHSVDVTAQESTSTNAVSEELESATSKPVVTDDEHPVGSDTVEASVVCPTKAEVANPRSVDVTTQESTTANAVSEELKPTSSKPFVTDNVHPVGSETVKTPVVCTTEVEAAKPPPVDVTTQESTTTNAVNEELESTDDPSKEQPAGAGNRPTDDKAVVPVELSKSQKKKLKRKHSAVQPAKPGELSKAYLAVPPVIDAQNLQEKPSCSTSSDANVPSTLGELEQNVSYQSNGSMLQRAVLPPLPALSRNKANGNGTGEDGGRASDVPDAKRNEVAGILFNIKLQEKIQENAELVAVMWPQIYENASDDDLVFGGMCMSYCQEMIRIRVPIAVFHMKTAFSARFDTKNPDAKLDLLKNIVLFNMNKPISGLFDNDLYDDFVNQRVRKYYCYYKTDREAQKRFYFFKAMSLFENKKYFIQDINYLSSLGGDDDEKYRLDEVYLSYFSATVTSQCVYELDQRYPNITDVSAELIELIGETDCKTLLNYLGLQYRIRHFNRSIDERNKENADLCTPRQLGMLKSAEESQEIESNWAPKDTEEFFVKCLESASRLDQTPEVQHIINRYRFLIQVQSQVLDVDVFNYMRKFKFDPATFDIKKHRFILDPWFTSK